MKEAGKSQSQETEIWWGGYCPWTMVPSLLVSFLLTGVIAWWGWTFVQRENVRLAILSLTGLVWLVQTMRFGYRFFGRNYHLTTRRLVQDWGLLNKGIRFLLLEDVESVKVERSNLEELLGVGRIVIRPRDPKQPPMVWSGVRHSGEVAERIRAMLAKRSRDATPAAAAERTKGEMPLRSKEG